MKLSNRDRWIVMIVAAAGAIACTCFLVLFFMTIIDNHLPWDHAPTAPQHYLAVGKSYSQGFTIGFFLAFSLALVAVSFAAWADDQRRARAGRRTRDGSTTPGARLVFGMTAPVRDPV